MRIFAHVLCINCVAVTIVYLIDLLCVCCMSTFISFMLVLCDACSVVAEHVCCSDLCQVQWQRVGCSGHFCLTNARGHRRKQTHTPTHAHGHKHIRTQTLTPTFDAPTRFGPMQAMFGRVDAGVGCIKLCAAICSAAPCLTHSIVPISRQVGSA